MPRTLHSINIKKKTFQVLGKWKSPIEKLENPEKNTLHILCDLGTIVIVNFWSDMLKSSVVLFCFNLNLLLFDLLMEETDNLDVHDLWISGTPGNPYLRIWIYQITFKIPRSRKHFPKTYFGNSAFVNAFFELLESRNLGPSNSQKCFLGNLGILEIYFWNFETLDFLDT